MLPFGYLAVLIHGWATYTYISIDASIVCCAVLNCVRITYFEDAQRKQSEGELNRSFYVIAVMGVAGASVYV